MLFTYPRASGNARHDLQFLPFNCSNMPSLFTNISIPSTRSKSRALLRTFLKLSDEILEWYDVALYLGIKSCTKRDINCPRFKLIARMKSPIFTALLVTRFALKRPLLSISWLIIRREAVFSNEGTFNV